jgi:hypothetical protein
VTLRGALGRWEEVRRGADGSELTFLIGSMRLFGYFGAAVVFLVLCSC